MRKRTTNFMVIHKNTPRSTSRLPVNSSRSRLVTKRRSTRHKQTSKPYCQQCIGPQLLGRSFQKAKKFTASSHQNAGLYIWVFKNFSRVIPPEARTLTAGGINDPSHTQHRPNLGPPQLTPVDQLYSYYCTLPIHLLHKQKILELVHTALFCTTTLPDDDDDAQICKARPK